MSDRSLLTESTAGRQFPYYERLSFVDSDTLQLYANSAVAKSPVLRGHGGRQAMILFTDLVGLLDDRLADLVPAVLILSDAILAVTNLQGKVLARTRVQDIGQIEFVYGFAGLVTFRRVGTGGLDPIRMAQRAANAALQSKPPLLMHAIIPSHRVLHAVAVRFFHPQIHVSLTTDMPSLPRKARTKLAAVRHDYAAENDFRAIAQHITRLHSDAASFAPGSGAFSIPILPSCLHTAAARPPMGSLSVTPIRSGAVPPPLTRPTPVIRRGGGPFLGKGGGGVHSPGGAGGAASPSGGYGVLFSPSQLGADGRSVGATQQQLLLLGAGAGGGGGAQDFDDDEQVGEGVDVEAGADGSIQVVVGRSRVFDGEGLGAEAFGGSLTSDGLDGDPEGDSVQYGGDLMDGGIGAGAGRFASGLAVGSSRIPKSPRGAVAASSPSSSTMQPPGGRPTVAGRADSLLVELATACLQKPQQASRQWTAPTACLKLTLGANARLDPTKPEVASVRSMQVASAFDEVLSMLEGAEESTHSRRVAAAAAQSDTAASDAAYAHAVVTESARLAAMAAVAERQRADVATTTALSLKGRIDGYKQQRKSLLAARRRARERARAAELELRVLRRLAGSSASRKARAAALCALADEGSGSEASAVDGDGVGEGDEEGGVEHGEAGRRMSASNQVPSDVST